MSWTLSIRYILDSSEGLGPERYLRHLDRLPTQMALGRADILGETTHHNVCVTAPERVDKLTAMEACANNEHQGLYVPDT